MARRQQSTPLRIIPLGGLGEVGKNMMAVECGNDIVVIDAGILFPKEDMLGVDLVLPDINYLLSRKDKLRAILITHGHEDHTGALPFVLRDLDVPVYAVGLAHSLIQVKLRENRTLRNKRLHKVEPGASIKLGQMTAEFFQVCHSIPDACGIALHTPKGLLVHTGDFKIDHTPVDGKKVNLQRLAQLGSEGVLLLMSDSTYAEVSGYTPSEQVVGRALEHAIATAQGRVIVATFASLIARVQQVIEAAGLDNRKVAITGRSMVNNVQVAIDHGYIRPPSDTLVELKILRKLPERQQVIVTTGSQGEPTSVLVRIANQTHPDISIQPGDTVIISASPIPGNEMVISRTIDNLYRQGAKVLHSRTALVHVHGHASQEELKTVLNLVKPKYFVPIHGEYRMLMAHANLAKQVGIPTENIFVLEDGDILEFVGKHFKVTEQISAGHIFVDGHRFWDSNSPVLRERQTLARNGFVIVIIPIDQISNRLEGDPQIISSGFIDTAISNDLIDRSLEAIVDRLTQQHEEILEPITIESHIRSALAAHLYKETGRRPMVLPVIIPVKKRG